MKAGATTAGVLIVALGVTDLVAAVSQGTFAAVLLGVSGAVLLLLLGVAALVARQLVRPMRAFARNAHRAAHETLPAAVAAIRAGPAGATPPEIHSVLVPGLTGPLAALAEAFSTMQSGTIELAVAQHRSERESADMLITLGRRNQSLLTRALHYITELESTEQDAVVLGQLFRLDHTTTRIRRNAESMLVLAGAHQTRTSSRPTAIVEVLRSALSEIEDYTRVDLSTIRPAAIAGSAVADLVHLLAELIENATHFSPPSARVTVTGDQVAPGGDYRIRIRDHGVGLTGPDLDDARTRVRRTARGRTSANLLGLDVVGLLAARHGMSVSLDPTPGGGGTTATVSVAPASLAPLSDLPPAPPPPAIPVAAVFTSPVPLPRPVSDAAPTPDLVLSPSSAPAPPAPRKAVSTRIEPPATSNGIPRRIRGAQLPDLGPAGDDTPHAPPDARRIRGRLNALQAGLTAARTNDIQPAARPHPAPRRIAEPRESDQQP